METWKLLLITLLSAVLLGCIIGIATGKHQLKKARSNYKPLLSVRERIIYFVCILVGAGCIAVGAIYLPSLTVDPAGEIGMQDGVNGGQIDPGMEGNPGAMDGAEGNPDANPAAAGEGTVDAGSADGVDDDGADGITGTAETADSTADTVSTDNGGTVIDSGSTTARQEVAIAVG